MRRNTALFVTISALSGFGSSTMSVVTGLWILDLTGSTSLAALAGLGIYAPQLAGPWLGGLLDRLPRRPTLITTNLVLAAALLTLLGVHAAEHTWLLFTVSLAYGISYVLIDAGETALLPRAFPAAGLAAVNGWRSSAQEGAKLVAPTVGAGLYAWQGGHPVAVLSAAMPILGAALYTAVRLRQHDSAPPARQRTDLRAGLAVLRTEPTISRTVALAAVTIAMSGFITAALYAVVTVDLRLPSTFLGVLLSAQGLGSIAGGLLVGRLLTRWGPVTVGAAGAILVAAGCLARCLPWPAPTVAASVITGIGLPWTLVAAVTAVQTHTSPAILGRVAATANTVMFAPIALAIPLGAAAVHLGGRPPLIIAAVICLAAAAAASLLRRPRTGGTGNGDLLPPEKDAGSDRGSAQQVDGGDLGGGGVLVQPPQQRQVLPGQADGYVDAGA
ncbi:MFS transporter [Polymorphospora rubra]|uniref:MFS transporter n=1 Tax=Polymorphospora rubra TaxID=338584 RepID=UPI0033C750B4